MAQLSRPYQVGLAAIALIAAVWLLLLQPHGSSPSSPAASASQPATPAHTQSAASDPSKSQGSSSHIYHGSAPGVEGLTKDIAKAHGAVAASEHNAQQLEHKSAEASSTTIHSSSTASTTAAAAPPKTVTKTTVTKTTVAKTTAPVHHAATASRQHEVEAQLAKGKVVLILFWDPRGADDQAVHRSVRQLRGQARLHIAVDEAKPGEVAAFGSITRGVQVYGTPTLLVVNGHGQALVLTGLQDSFTIGQAISEAHAS